MITGLIAAVLLTMSLGVAEPAPPSGPAAPPPCERCADVDSTPTGNLRTGVTRPASDTVPGRGTPATHGEAPERTSWLRVDEEMTPACFGNTRTESDAICAGALTSCPSPFIRWFVFHREWRVERVPGGGTVETLQRDWYQEPGSFCLGDDDPGVPTIGRVISQVQSAFQDLPLPVPALQVDPAPTTLVNIPTAFFAGGERAATFSPTILGVEVRIEATASRWDWTWGDGTTSSTDSPGVPKRPVVAHEYTQARDHEVGVITTWTGTFTIAGSDEVFAIRTPAVVSGPPVTVQVREARTELVAG